MRRKLFNFAAVVSLMLSVATIVLWVRSYDKVDAFRATSARWQGNSLKLWGIIYSADHGRLTVFLTHGESTFSGRERAVEAEVRMNQAVTPEGRMVKWTLPEGAAAPTPPLRAEAQVDSHGVFLNVHFGEFSFRPNPVLSVTGVRKELDFIVPFWLVALAAGVLPTFWLARWLIRWLERRRDEKSRRCVSCHYNLTGNTSGTCPECGTPIAKAADDKCPTSLGDRDGFRTIA